MSDGVATPGSSGTPWSRAAADSCDGSPMLHRVDVWQFVDGRACKLSDSHSLRADCGHREHDGVTVTGA